MRTHAKHIALEKIRITLNLLRKSSLYLESSNQVLSRFYSIYMIDFLMQESPIVSQLKNLQRNLRSCETGNMLTEDYLIPNSLIYLKLLIQLELLHHSLLC